MQWGSYLVLSCQLELNYETPVEGEVYVLLKRASQGQDSSIHVIKD